MVAITSTYRAQLTADFGFDEATALVPYWARLGISHLYLSPILKSAKGSTHGYDVVDPTCIDPELGGAEGHARLTAALAEHGMGQIIDVVPNHMAISGRENRWWWDVLRIGRKSPYAAFFDIDWDAPDDRLHNRIVLPVLGDHYGAVLDRGELRLDDDGDEVVLRYFDNVFPIDQSSLAAGTEIARVNTDADQLDALICQQNFRLAYWRVAGEQLDYRRFFDVDSLVALRAERNDVFEATHPVILGWLQDGTVDGIRIDHVDGLRDPAGYLQRLRDRSGQAWIGVEKILEPNEHLPVTWPVQGTTGYDTLGLIDGLFVEPDNESVMDVVYRRFTGDDSAWAAVVDDAKWHVVRNVLGSDVERLTDVLTNICEKWRDMRDYTRSQCKLVIESLVVAFPVYRTYIDPARSQITSVDRQYVDAAMSAVEEDGEVDADLLRHVREVLLLERTGSPEAELVCRFQQLTSPVMAKGVEDTAFYRYARFLMANEVGNQPGRWCTRPDDLHQVASASEKTWPQSMNASSTHDTKRSEDTRMRLAALSELSEQWEAAVGRWSAVNAKHKRPSPSDPNEMWPDRRTEYFLYQTLVAAHPLDAERAVPYMLKATKEAKLQTSWTSPDPAYDEAVEAFVRSVCSDSELQADLANFVSAVELAGRTNSVAASVLKLTMPGIPDTYQGCELWDHSLVDPDNRRPVDYQMRARALERLDAVPVLEDDAKGLSKMLVLQRCLELRKRRPDCFDDRGTYTPLYCQGKRAAHAVAFKRGASVVSVVPRLVVGLGGQWEDTFIELPPGQWANVLTGEDVEGGRQMLGELLKRFPVAVLEASS